MTIKFTKARCLNWINPERRTPGKLLDQSLVLTYIYIYFGTIVHDNNIIEK